MKSFEIIWANLDPNMHLRHTAYNDYAAQTRLSYFMDHGLSLQLFTEIGLGPVLFREDTRFLKEVRMGETIYVTCELSGLRQDCSRWNIFHQILKSDQSIAATIQVEGAWLDLNLRKLAVPQNNVQEIIKRFPKTKDFEWLPDSKRK